MSCIQYFKHEADGPFLGKLSSTLKNMKSTLYWNIERGIFKHQDTKGDKNIEVNIMGCIYTSTDK
jgi:hypothetical protein